MVTNHKRACLLCALLLLQCTEESVPQIPGGMAVSHAAPVDHQLSLVSFVLPKITGLKSVTSKINGKYIKPNAVGFDSQLIVTVAMQQSKASRLEIRCLSNTGVYVFKSYLTPKFSLSLFDGLHYGDKVVFLRDHGSEIELYGGKNWVDSQETIRLWLGNHFADAVRLHVTGPNGDGGVLAVQCRNAVVVRGGRLESNNQVVLVGGGESVGIIIPSSHLPNAIQVTQGNLGN